MKKRSNILFTGGHAGSTAHAVISKLVKDKYFYGYNLIFVGSKSAVEGNSIMTFENIYLPKLGVKYIGLRAGRFQRKFTRWTIPSLLKIPLGFFDSLKVLLNEKPVITISFGGYVAFPVVILSWILGIPVIIHEQTSQAGLGNLLSIPFAKLILLARKSSLKYFPSKKSYVIGNPISELYFEISKKTKLTGTPLIFVTGGSRGSKTINEVIFSSLRELLPKYKIIHQTGSSDFVKATNIKKNLPGKLSINYEIFSLLEPKNFTQMLDKSDLVVSRSGANTVSAIIASKRLSILIPLPFSQNNEQYENAKLVRDYRSGKIITQNDFNKKLLITTIHQIIENFESLVKKFKTCEFDDSLASEKFIKYIKTILNEKKSAA